MTEACTPRLSRLAAAPKAAVLPRLAALAKDNWLFTLALGAGSILRAVAVIGYPGMLWFIGDSFLYLGAALRPRPDLSKSVGYSFFLRALEPFHSLILVAVVQHLMGLAIGVLLYLLLRRAGVKRHWAALAAAPVLLDGNEIELEHMMMAETLFTFLLVVSVALLLWRPRPSWPACLAAGLLTGYAITVRSEGVILPLILAGYLLIRRVGWRPFVAIIAGCAAPVAGYALWFHSATGDYAMTRSEGIFLWGRVSSFAECSQIKPPADERSFCLTTPLAKRLPPGAIIWETPAVHAMPGGPVGASGNHLLRDFAIRAILAQPVGYLHAVASDARMAVDWPRYPYPSRYSASLNYFHLKPQVLPANRSWIPGGTAIGDVRAYGRASPSRVIKPVAFLIAGYQRIFYTWGPLFGAILVIGLGGLIRFWRRLGGAALLPWTVAVVLLALPIALAGFSYRYMLPVLPFSCLAAGLAFAPGRPETAADSPAADDAADPADTENPAGPENPADPENTGPENTAPGSASTPPGETGASQGEAIRLS